jgi:hypothetical protein
MLRRAGAAAPLCGSAYKKLNKNANTSRSVESFGWVCCLFDIMRALTLRE